MSSSEDDVGQASALIERLLVDPVFRGSFRRDPAGVCRANGLDALADELSAGGKAMNTLELRESKSSLAGVVLALASEGIGAAELHGLIGHKLSGQARAAAAAALKAREPKPRHGVKAPRVGSSATSGAGDATGGSSSGSDGASGSSGASAGASPATATGGGGGSSGPVAATPAAHGVAKAADATVTPSGPGSSGAADSSAGQSTAPQTGAPTTNAGGGSGAASSAADQASSGQGANGAQAASAGGGHSQGTASGGYVNPLPKDATIGRTDMGVDADMTPGDAIVAPGKSRVLGVMQNWYEGQPYVALQLLDGPNKGQNYYVAEQINVTVSPGQIVEQGQPIAHYASSGTGIEIGWAGSNWEQTLAQAQGNTGDASHGDAPAGISFRKFLDGLPHAGSAGAGGSAGSGQAAVPSSAPSAGSASAAQASSQPAAGQQSPTAEPGSSQPPPPAQPGGTASFRAIEQSQQSHSRNTLQFLPTVKPAPGSPLYDQSSTGGQGGSSGAVEHAATAQDASGGQGAGLVPESSGSSISVSSSLLTNGQEKFAARLAEQTGLDPRVISAWELAEESGSAAQAREAAGNYNWLNIGYFDSGAGQIAFNKAFSDPVTAADQTANFLKGKWGGASSSIRAILNTVGESPQQQMNAIASSDWASSHYGGGANLDGTYNELTDLKVQQA